LPSEAQLEALHGSSDQAAFWLNCDAPEAPERRPDDLLPCGYRDMTRHLASDPEGMTMRQAFESHKQGMLNKGASSLSIAEYDLAFRHLNDWADVPLRRLTGTVGRRMVRERQLKIGKTKGKAAADKTMRGLRAWWNTAKREDLGLGESPTINVAWYKSQPRKSALRTRDLEQFGRELEALRRLTSSHDPDKHVADLRGDGAFSDWKDAEGKPVKFTPHGLRATFIGAGHAAGVTDRYVELLANHKQRKGDVHGGYVPEDDLPALRVATQKITDYLRQRGRPF